MDRSACYKGAAAPALAMLLLLAAGCDELPGEDPGALDKVTLSVLLQPGSSGDQELRLTAPLPLGSPVNYETSFVPGAEIRLRNGAGDEIPAQEDPAGARYWFDRADFPLMPYDTVSVTLGGSWEGWTFDGQASTVIVSDDDFEFTEKPDDRSHGYDADTLMFHDESRESGWRDPAAFHLDWEHLEDGIGYSYQIEFVAVVGDNLGEWMPTPHERLWWLRDDEELAWQWGPYPDIRSVPGEYAGRQRVSWGAFVFVDSLDFHEPGRRMGYYEVRVRRLTPELWDYLFSTHFWIREFEHDPIPFNLRGERCQGIVASCALREFRVAIVDE